MLPMLRNPKRGQSPFFKRALTPFWIVLLLSNQSFADAYDDARAEVIAAYQAQDYAAMQDATVKALEARPGYHGAMFNMAFAKALAEDYAGALQVLQQLAVLGVDYGVHEMEEFAAVQELEEWQTYEAAVEQLKAPVGNARVAFSFPGW